MNKENRHEAELTLFFSASDGGANISFTRDRRRKRYGFEGQ
jgi:hypothetical protein